MEDDVEKIHFFLPAAGFLSCYSCDGQHSQGRKSANLALCAVNITPGSRQYAPSSTCHTVVLSLEFESLLKIQNSVIIQMVMYY